MKGSISSSSSRAPFAFALSVFLPRTSPPQALERSGRMAWADRGGDVLTVERHGDFVQRYVSWHVARTSATTHDFLSSVATSDSKRRGPSALSFPATQPTTRENFC